LRYKQYGNLDLRDGRSRPQFLDSSDAEIVLAFNSELRGFANYYAIVDSVKSSLDRLELVVIRSVLATVASRHRKSASWAKKHLRMGADYGVTSMVRGKPRVMTPMAAAQQSYANAFEHYRDISPFSPLRGSAFNLGGCGANLFRGRN
jgi:hypothetical protein